MSLRILFGLTIVCGGVLAAAWVLAEETQAKKPPPVDFNRDVRPILAKNCYACHGMDEKHREGGLRLDKREGATGKTDSGAVAIVPGNLDESELYARIIEEDETARMPPKASGKALNSEQIALLKRWIEEGAPYAAHWSFVKPQRPVLPAVQDKSWPRNGIDFFVLHRLEQEGLKPSPEADRYALIRRLSLDLRGLPATPAEVEAFVNDKRPDAYEQLVDQLLGDPAYGERWARMWLDLARYADSAGYGSDPLRTIWRYRDWVIDAFNQNKPFDQFTAEQLAGDLLPNPTLDQLMATAFHRNTKTNTEGGTDDEEFRVEAVRDRIDTTMQVWMGLTMGCAKCHDHKYEPITQQEYYQFFGFFNQTADNDRPDEGPTIPAPTQAMRDQVAEIERQVAALKQKLETPSPELAVAQTAWESGLRSNVAWVTLDPHEMTAASGATFRKLDDGSLLVSGKLAEQETYTIAARTELAGVTAFRLETIPDPSLPVGGAGRAPDGNFVLSKLTLTAADADNAGKSVAARFVRVELPGEMKILSLAEVQVLSGSDNIARAGKATQSSVDYDGPPPLAIDGNTDGRFTEAKSTTHTKAESNPWWEVDLGDAKPVDQVVIWNRTDAEVGSRLAKFRVLLLDKDHNTLWQQDVADSPKPKAELLPSGNRIVALTQAAADFSQETFPVANALNQKDVTQSGWAVGPQVAKPHAAVFTAGAPLAQSKSTLLTFRLEHRFKMPHYALGRFRLSVTNEPNMTRRVAVPADVLAIVDTPAGERTPDQQTKLAAHYRTVAPALQGVRDEIAKLEKSKPVFPTVPVLQELAAEKQRKTYLMEKGNFLSKGPEVSPAVPAAFHPLANDEPRNRLGVARWLVSADNPLTARVTVNRFWAQLFGKGFVETEEDFGAQGEPPSHPQLLDWLAVEFMQPEPGGVSPRSSPAENPKSEIQNPKSTPWDMKRLLRLIVTSATYRQSSRVTPELLAKDPRNQLFARGARFRLEAEMVRDQALALGGLLSRKLGGPSVYPPQPPGLWQAAFNGQRTWATSEGEDKYRRGLYTFWRRTIPYPSMATFDAPSREICSIRRIRTNTPLQAFVTLNDPVYVEAAQSLARRIVKEGGTTANERAAFALRLCLGRPPQPEQLSALLQLHASEFAHYRQDPKAATQMATDPLGPLPDGADAADLAAWTVVANVLLNLDGVLAKG